MSYQIRHKEYGIFQGEFLGLVFWYPTSNIPELGLMKFFSKEDADLTVEICCHPENPSVLLKEDFIIESFDTVTHLLLTTEK